MYEYYEEEAQAELGGLPGMPSPHASQRLNKPKKIIQKKSVKPQPVSKEREREREIARARERKKGKEKKREEGPHHTHRIPKTQYPTHRNRQNHVKRRERQWVRQKPKIFS